MAVIQEAVRGALPGLANETFCRLVEELMLVVGVEDVEDLPFVKEEDIKHLLSPVQCRRMLLAFRRKEDEHCPQQELHTPLSISTTALTPPQPDSQTITLTLTSSDLAQLHPNAWAENFSLSWEKLNTKMRLAIAQEKRPEGTDRRHLVRVVVDSIQEHCTNPTRSQCAEVAKAIVRKYPKSFADLTEEGDYMGCGYFTLLTQIKTRVEHVNRDNTMARLRKPKRKAIEGEASQDNQVAHSSVKIDSYGCVNWQPQECPEGETLQSLEEKRQLMVAIFNEEGPRGAARGCVGDYMDVTYILQRQHINTNPPPDVAELEEKWPFLFMKKWLCAHFSQLTGIQLHERLSGALQTKGKRILLFFNSQRTKWKREIQNVLTQIEEEPSNQDLSAILVMMAHFKEKEEALFLLADESATKNDVEAQLTLPGTPRLIMLGNSILGASKWMVSVEGRIVCTLPNQTNFAAALTVLFGCFFVFNIQYQEEASTILEFIQRFLVRINPDDGTKCASKTAVSCKSGQVVQRKSSALNLHVASFLQDLTEFEWKTKN